MAIPSSSSLATLALGLSMSANAGIPPAEHDALVSLYISTNGGAWVTKTNWTDPGASECSWYGIQCDATLSHVIGISLDANNLTGTLPTLDALPRLETFIVGSSGNCLEPPWNQIQGSLPSLSKLTGLTDFEASCNQFTGTIPELAELTQLSTFGAWNNHLTGSIPELAGLTNLTYFDVFENRLTGVIPSLEGLTSLTGFDVSDNLLTGPLPPLTGLASLNSFIASRNQLSGSIPVFGELAELEDFYVDYNQLTGSIPSLSGLTRLGFFVVGNNHLTGALPSEDPPLWGALLCPNDFPASSYIDNPAWDKATDVTPWYSACDMIFVDGFNQAPTSTP
jgi:Leucine-rich repeat (LRR) protein